MPKFQPKIHLEQHQTKTFPAGLMSDQCHSRRNKAGALAHKGCVVSETGKYCLLVNNRLIGLSGDPYHSRQILFPVIITVIGPKNPD